MDDGLGFIRLYVGEFVRAQWARIVAEDSLLADCICPSRRLLVQIKEDGEASADLCLNHGHTVIGARNWWLAIGALRKIFLARRTKLVHAHSYRSVLLAKMASIGLTPKITIVYEIHGAVAFESLYRNRGRSSRLARFVILYLLESVAVLLSSRLLLVSATIRKYYPVARLKKCEVISRGLMPVEKNDGDLEVPSAFSRFVCEARDANQLIVAYAGNTGPWQNVRATVRLMQCLASTGHVRCVVLTNEPNSFVSLLGEQESENWYIDSVAQSSVLSCLSRCDVGIILRDDLVLNKVASPTKLFEYLAAGLSVVATSAVKAADRFAGTGAITYVDLDRIQADEYAPCQLLERIKASRRAAEAGVFDGAGERVEARESLLALYRLPR